MKIFTISQVAELDRYTIVHEPVSAIDLMERASLKLASWIESQYDHRQRVAVFAGPGNNGGDALAVSRILLEKQYKVVVFIPDFGKRKSACFMSNLARLKAIAPVTVVELLSDGENPNMSKFDFVIDGLFGSGLSRPLTDFPARLVAFINHSGLPIVSIDIPSGLMGESVGVSPHDEIVRAHYTLTLQFPKLCFFFRENEQYTGRWVVLPIGIHPDGIETMKTPWHYTDKKSVASFLHSRALFSHKGTYGHALLVAGSYGKMGAAVLAARGCLRSGVGLLTIHIPQVGGQILQTTVPEAMVNIDKMEKLISEIPMLPKCNAIGMGPGIGQEQATIMALRIFLENYNHPVVIDADALNIIAAHPDMRALIPENSILTPHPLEFERLAGSSSSDCDRLNKARTFAQDHHLILILKGAHTIVALPDGNCWFNSTGNPGMATGGSGDVLTGIITGLLAQHYSPQEAALLGVFIHGLAADLALSELAEESLLASDIVEHLGKAFTCLKHDSHFEKCKKNVNFEGL